MTIALSILGLGIIIFIHELGHFLVSLALGMRPRRFYIGFPPAVWKTTRNGIEYGLGAIPLGGFVKIPGMHRPAPVDVDIGVGKVAAEAPMLAAPTNRLRTALAAGDHDTARDAVRVLRELVDEQKLDARADAAARKSLDDLDDALGPNAYWRAATWKRIAAIAAGPAANLVSAVIIFAVLYMTAAGVATTRIDQVTEGSPAAAAGLQRGDRIQSIDGTRVTADQVSGVISESNGKPLTLVVVRDGAGSRSSRLARRRPTARTDSGSSSRARAYPSPRRPWRLSSSRARSPRRSEGRSDACSRRGGDEISSPVGIVQGSSDAAKQGAVSFFFVLGLISLSVALLNLLPLLPLDGGHIVFAIAEGIRGRAVRREIYERVSVFGIAIVLLLFMVGLTNDIDRLT